MVNKYASYILCQFWNTLIEYFETLVQKLKVLLGISGGNETPLE